MRYDSVFWTLLLVSTLFTPLLSGAEQSPLPVVVANDNRTPAGGLKDGVLHLRLELRQARWYAEGADGVYEDVYAFAEEGHPPQSSGPLLRVPQGEEGLLMGASIVDPPGVNEHDRIFVIVEWEKNHVLGNGDGIFASNGKSWPATERLTYEQSETVHWR